ncbi:membrane-bound lytic murein transglycosylase E [Serratia symbiotica str. 'Cinara cedri']|nr:membrane-bound lytic murein transglycosylase E [Serratia symbiotica str. 'Cinara cedri']
MMDSVKIKIYLLIVILLLSGCAKDPSTINVISNNKMIKVHKQYPVQWTEIRIPYNTMIERAANQYGVDKILIKAIIQVESGFNPNVVSSSNAVGLMQLKSSTAGRDVYRLKGLSGKPSLHDLKNPVVNIDLGVAYINILQSQQLAGINNPQILRYATIVAYVNGADAMLRIFSLDKRVAVNRINQMSPADFYNHIQKNHPSSQAQRYLSKVTLAYKAMLQSPRIST